MGQTGIGKTTLFRLMLAFITPEKGTLTLYDGHEEHPASVDTRGNFVFVPQGNTLMSGTVRYNLQLARPEATDEELRQVLHVAMADFVNELPQGIDTMLGERGIGLSEGQAQRIAIARGLLRPGSILLLDEISSSLDEQTEQELFRLKMADYAADDAGAFLLREAGKTVGYCVYFAKEEVYGEEVLSLTDYGPLLHELRRIAGDRPASAKLPPDADAPGEVRPQNVMLAPDDIWRAMEASGKPCFCVDEY